MKISGFQTAFLFSALFFYFYLVLNQVQAETANQAVQASNALTNISASANSGAAGLSGTNLPWKDVPAEDAAKAAGIQKGNLLSDSSFESLEDLALTRHGSKWWSESGSIVRSNALHGNVCVKSFALSDPYCFRKDIPLTLSFHAKAPEGGEIEVIAIHGHRMFPWAARLGINHTDKGSNGIRKIFIAKAGWSRYSFSFLPATVPETSLQNIVFQIKGQEDMLFDAVQLEEGGLSEYKPKEKEFFVNVSRREEVSYTTLFFDDENVPVTLVATRASPGTLNADLIVEDFWTKEVVRKPVLFDVPEGKVKMSVQTNLPILPRGAYRVYLRSGEVESRKIVFAVIGRNLSEGSEIMGTGHWTICDDANASRGLIEALGITWSREQGAGYWMEDEKRNSQWPRLDEDLAEKAKAKKVRFWTSCLATGAEGKLHIPEPWSSVCKTGTVAEALTYPGVFYNGWLAYIREAVKHFKNVRYWESWNEPYGGTPGLTPERFVQLLKLFHDTVKEADPDAVVVGFSALQISHFVLKGIAGLQAEALKLGGQQYCDIISYHGYFGTWPESTRLGEGGQSLAGTLETIRRECRRVGGEKPIWDNEFTLWGTSWYDGERVPRRLRNHNLPGHSPLWHGAEIPFDEAVSRIVHYVTIAYSHGVRMFSPHCFVHSSYNCPQNQGPVEYDHPAYDYDLSIKPRTISYAVVCNKMNSAKLVKEYAGKDLFIYTFDKPGGSLAVVFMREGKKAMLSLSTEKSNGLIEKLSFRNVFDAPFQDVQEKAGKITLSMVGQPVYIESQMSGQELADLLTNPKRGLIVSDLAHERSSVKVVGPWKFEVKLSNVLSSELKGRVTIKCQGKSIVDSRVSLDSRETRMFPVSAASAINSFENVPLEILFMADGESEPYVKEHVGMVLLSSGKRESAIVIDGDLSDWKKEYGIPLPDNFREFGRPPKFAAPIPWKGKDDLSATMYTCWDEKNFYLALKIKDDVFARPPETVGAYQYDNLQVYFDTMYQERRRGSQTRYYENVYNYNFSALKKGLEATCDCAPGSKSGPTPEIKCAFREIEGGMVYEIAFPAEQLSPIPLKEGSAFGFALLINDNDNDYRKRGLTLTPSGTEPHMSPDLYPVLILK